MAASLLSWKASRKQARGVKSIESAIAAKYSSKLSAVSGQQESTSVPVPSFCEELS
ncbi:MAG: hypothetical protein F6J93_01695 [Oscillatoria sp. SIO1A7]|nr:hypothetical protein [Oscillatoria sp. SIO1A7]